MDVRGKKKTRKPERIKKQGIGGWGVGVRRKSKIKKIKEKKSIDKSEKRKEDISAGEGGRRLGSEKSRCQKTRKPGREEVQSINVRKGGEGRLQKGATRSEPEEKGSEQ